MRTQCDKIRKALRSSNIEESLERLFGGRLSRESVSVVEDSSARQIVLTWQDGQTYHRMPINQASPAQYTVESLATLVCGDVVREIHNDDGIRKCFDASALAHAFLKEYRVLYEKFVGEGINDEVGATINRFMTRVLLVRFLQTKGWFSINGQQDYLQALYKDWKRDPGPHFFYQRLAVVFFNALNEPRQEARWLARSLVGEVPYLGGGMFAPELYEREMQTHKGYASVPDEMFEQLLGEGGLLTRFEFSLEESAPNESVVAVTPEVMGAVFEAFLAGKDEPVYPDTASHRMACREVVAHHLGLNDDIKLPKSSVALREFRERLDGLHIFDGGCRCGSYLVSTLEEVADLYCMMEPGGGAELVRAAIKRRVLTENIRGLDQDELAVQVARFRLALCVFADDAAPMPLPDLRTVVKRGGAIDGRSVKWRFPPESQHTEYKASFEWDSRRQMRSDALRFATLKTVVAFLNAEGGTLYIGVKDNGAPVGIGADLELIEDQYKHDAFQNRFREILKNHIDPIPLSKVAITLDDAMGLTIAIVKVAPQNGVTYFVNKDQNGRLIESVYVRDGNRTIELSGRARDQFVVLRSRNV